MSLGIGIMHGPRSWKSSLSKWKSKFEQPGLCSFPGSESYAYAYVAFTKGKGHLKLVSSPPDSEISSKLLEI